MDSSLNIESFQLQYDAVDRAGAKLQCFANLCEGKGTTAVSFKHSRA